MNDDEATTLTKYDTFQTYLHRRHFVHFAYIDAGTGSMALQILLAGALSVVYAVHTRWAAFRKFLTRRHKTP